LNIASFAKIFVAYLLVLQAGNVIVHEANRKDTKSMNFQRVLVIGGNGFIGCNVVNALISKGIGVVVYDTAFPKKMNEKATYFQGNFSLQTDIGDILDQVDSVVYLLSSVTPQTSMENSCLPYTLDIPLLLHLLDSCLNHGVNRVVFSSSGGTIYGDTADDKHCDESLQEAPINHYGISKLAIEKILLMYNKLNGMDNVVLRLANPYGSGQDPMSGIGAVAAFVYAAIMNKPIHLYGNGNYIRDYVAISDVAEAFYDALVWKSGDCTPIFNIGSGKKVMIREILEWVSEALGSDLIIEHYPCREFDVRCNYLSIVKAKRYLHYSPTVMPEDGIKEYALNIK